MKQTIIENSAPLHGDFPDISVAPMLDWTDRHCRYFHRLLSPHVRLYTEMVTTGAILHGDKDRLLVFNSAEHPVALQLGGSEPQDLAECARIGESYGYDEINLNCGCPSERVQRGAFGACLMAEPENVARSVGAMTKAISLPVTVKCRIGIDDCEEASFLSKFIRTVSEAGCRTFIIHARKAWLKGLSPKENREVPPLNYDLPAQIKADFSHLQIILNGGIKTLEDTQKHLQRFDGVMIGRAAYQNPTLLLEIERSIFGGETQAPQTIAQYMAEYMEKEAAKSVPFNSIARHMIGLFQSCRGARHWRRTLSMAGRAQECGLSAKKFITDALNQLDLS